MIKLIRLFNTIKYLKLKQIYFRLFYILRKIYRKKIGFIYPSFENTKSYELILNPSIKSSLSYEDQTFTFLNLSKKFENEINWNFNEFGKLWTYNINYFEFLNQKKFDKKDGIKLIYDFITNENILKDAKESFPISLRAINWIKFLSKYNIRDKKIDNILYAHCKILIDNVEYHLLGNHLLENGFSLLFAAYYFEDENFYYKAKNILIDELSEQILKDGAHFELSPMYHQIMLFRVLDCINLIKNNKYKNKELLFVLEKKASMMLGWLKQITYINGDIPLFNDSANGIAPSSKDIFKYAKNLNIDIKFLPLKESAYRKITINEYECTVDIGNIGPDYIPGHAHSDTFSFEVQVKNKAFIVDTGLSTYEPNERRTLERSTLSHNTVQINNKNQSEVWAGFRVANRAKIVYINEDENVIEATHDGYKKDNIFHTRKWTFENNKIIVKDTLSKECDCIARIHFHPDVNKKEIFERIKVENISMKIIDYEYSPEFNKKVKALAIEIIFKKELELEICIKENK